MSTLLARLSAILLLNPLGIQMLVASDELPDLSGPPLAAHGDEDRAARSDLLSVLDDVSSLATKSRMNADFVPGILSVLHGEELVALGVHSVWEALALVPGVQIDRNSNGITHVTIRGLQHGNGNVKLLLNSAAMNNAFGGYSNILQIPVEQVDRIEVIRGPGSAIHGEFAFSGVINVITRTEGNRVYVRTGSGETEEVGGNVSLGDAGNAWRVSLNGAGWSTDGVPVMSGPDMLYGLGSSTVSLSPGRIDNSEAYRFAVLSVEHDDLALLAQYSYAENGTFFGALNVLPPEDDPAYTGYSEMLMVELRKGLRFSSTLSGELKLSWSQYTGHWGQHVLPPGSTYPFLTGYVYPDGVFLDQYVRNDRREANLNLSWDGWSGHRWQLDLSAATTGIDDAWWASNGDFYTKKPLGETRRYGGDQSFIDPGASRDIRSLAVQDQFRVNPRLEMTAGLRYDSYSDVGDNLSPRLAAVWTLTDEHILKAQYAEAFFPPTLFQVYGVADTLLSGNLDAEPETIATSELGYINRRGTSVARVTLFESQVKDLIVIEANRYVNHGRARLAGVETEWEQRLSSAWKLMANLSYTDTHDLERGGPLAGASDWLGNLSLLYRPRPDILLTGRWRYVGDRHRATNDPRTKPLPGYDDVSLTLNWLNVGLPGLTLRAGVKNLLAESIKSPALAYTYVDDYPLLDERIWWAQLSYQLP